MNAFHQLRQISRRSGGVVAFLVLTLTTPSRGWAQAVQSFDDLALRVNLDDQLQVEDQLGVKAAGRLPRDEIAQVATLEELRGELSPGDFISLVQTTGDSVRGRLVRFADTAVDIRAETRQVTGKQRLDVTVPLGTIRSLERPRDSSRNGVFIGTGVGAGVSLGMFIHAAAVDYNEIDEWGPLYLAMGAVYTGVGALLGWAIDSAHSKPHVRFNAPSSER